MYCINSYTVLVRKSQLSLSSKLIDKIIRKGINRMSKVLLRVLERIRPVKK